MIKLETCVSIRCDGCDSSIDGIDGIIPHFSNVTEALEDAENWDWVAFGSKHTRVWNWCEPCSWDVYCTCKDPEGPDLGDHHPIRGHHFDPKTRFNSGRCLEDDCSCPGFEFYDGK